MSVTCHRLLPLYLGWILASSTHAAFERSPFAAPPPASALPRSGAAAGTVVSRRPCGWLGHDRPFGLAALAGRYGVLATPLRGGLIGGAGWALRGPERHREHATWLAVGGQALARLRIGVAVHRRGWSGPGHGFSAWLPGIAVRLLLPRRWRLLAQMRPGAGPIPGRWTLMLQRSDADGALEIRRASSPSAPSRTAIRIASHLSPRLDLWLAGRSRPGELGIGATVRRRGLRAWVSAHEHASLGTTPAWGVGRACW